MLFWTDNYILLSWLPRYDKRRDLCLEDKEFSFHWLNSWHSNHSIQSRNGKRSDWNFQNSIAQIFAYRKRLWIIRSLSKEKVTVMKQKNSYINIISAQGEPHLIETFVEVSIKTPLLSETFQGCGYARILNN